MAQQPSILVISSYRETLNTVRPEGRWFLGLVRDHGYSVTIMTPREEASYLDEMEAVGVRIIDWHPSSKWSRDDSRRIADELAANHYDILHLFNNVSVVSGIRAASGWPGKVVTYRGYTGNIHAWDPTAYLGHLNPRVDMVTCVSQAVADSFPGKPFFDPKKLAVVGKGHEPQWYANVVPTDLQQEFGIPAEKTVLIMVANARRMKGMNYLGAAIKSLPEDLGLHFLFAGRGLQTPDFQSDLKASHYADAYTFSGFRTDVLNLIAAADISLLASVKGEGLSKVLLESMFLGRPTIMTDIGGNKGLAVDHETALVIPPKDPVALSAAVEELVLTPHLRQRLGEGAKEYMAKHYGAVKTTQDLHNAYGKLLGRQGNE
ncbi:glycosyltransferase family 4 protein [Lewinella sp. 4G2]|uniref:glycosyltransferase family 4 protein n=1 Tax=Lewinella sp. 4G2 TaxID=1803372 RepID=UPI0007B491E4|nr:glycosyltransferase family 4 protein [Lewinella sp. 4G2]OAV44898.1 hypothetical protein A3850_010515 [Lewinella sp. 4G2]